MVNRRKGYFDTDFPSETIIQLFYFFSFSFWVSEVHCFLKEWNYINKGTIKRQTYYCLGIK
jgi:hypothetical protein